MPQVLDYDTPEMGLYDSANGNSIVADTVLDVSDLCKPSESQILIKYGNAERGRIAQIHGCYKRGKDIGWGVHYFLPEHTARSLAEDVVFARECRCLEVDADKLATVIYEYSRIKEKVSIPQSVN